MVYGIDHTMKGKILLIESQEGKICLGRFQLLLKSGSQPPVLQTMARKSRHLHRAALFALLGLNAWA